MVKFRNMPPSSELRSRLWIWFVWLALFYVVWLSLIVVGDSWGAVAGHWPIAAAMAAGSYVAGSTPMGGGTVGFPVLVLFFDMPASLGRDFSFACQSIGMTSAGIFIVARRQVVAWGIVRWAFGTTLVVTPLSLMFVAPHLSPQFITVMFAVMWCSFGIMHFTLLSDILQSSRLSTDSEMDAFLGIMIGLLGGISASLTGVGIDMLLYVVMVSLLRVDLRIAIPTSVIIMALNSMIGVASTVLLGSMPQEAYENWLAAAPVVALGAPLGAFIVQYISRSKTLLFVSSLCIVQFVWTLIDKSITGWSLVLALGSVALLYLAFRGLYALGGKYASTDATGAAADAQGQAYAAGVRDVASGAYGRSYFYDRGQQEFMSSTRHERTVSVLTVRLVNGSKIRDSYSTIRWEAFLRILIERIASVSRSEDVCARLDDDRFAVLMSDTNTAGVRTYTDRLAKTLEAPIALEGGITIPIETRIGFASMDSTQSSFADLVDAATVLDLAEVNQPVADDAVLTE